MAAMLSRKLGRHEASSVPVVPGHKSRVEVSLVPDGGEADWPFKADVLSEPISMIHGRNWQP